MRRSNWYGKFEVSLALDHDGGLWRKETLVMADRIGIGPCICRVTGLLASVSLGLCCGARLGVLRIGTGPSLFEDFVF
jgi:hypothetical protein